MKRIYIIIASLIIMLTLTSCDEKKSDLLILNWGDYISEDVISLFEEEYGVSVRVATTDSNEQMLFNIQNKTAQYDLDGNLIAIFNSANEAAIAIGKNSNAARNIRSVCYGDRITAYGYKWKFLD